MEDEVYGVERVEGGYIVRHFPVPEGGRPCCKVAVQISAADRAQWHEWETIDRRGGSSALHRAYLAIERKHGRIPDTPGRESDTAQVVDNK